MASSGAFSKFAVDDVLPFDISSKCHEFITEDMRASYARIYNNGIRGTRSRHSERVRLSTITVAGSITMTPSPTELDFWLPKILGAAEALDVFDVANTLPEFQLLFDKVGQTHAFTGCKVGRAIFRSGTNQPLTMVLEIVGQSEETPGSIAFPAISIDADPMYVFHDSDSGFSIGGTLFEFDEWQLVIDNLVQTRYMNSRTATSILPQDREITMSFNTPYSAATELALYNTNRNALNNSAGVLTFTNGGRSLRFDLGCMEPTVSTPAVGGKTEILFPHNYAVYAKGATPDIKVTNDSVA